MDEEVLLQLFRTETVLPWSSCIAASVCSYHCRWWSPEWIKSCNFSICGYSSGGSIGRLVIGSLWLQTGCSRLHVDLGKILTLRCSPIHSSGCEYKIESTCAKKVYKNLFVWMGEWGQLYKALGVLRVQKCQIKTIILPSSLSNPLEWRGLCVDPFGAATVAAGVLNWLVGFLFCWEPSADNMWEKSRCEKTESINHDNSLIFAVIMTFRWLHCLSLRLGAAGSLDVRCPDGDRLSDPTGSLKAVMLREWCAQLFHPFINIITDVVFHRHKLNRSSSACLRQCWSSPLSQTQHHLHHHHTDDVMTS